MTQRTINISYTEMLTHNKIYVYIRNFVYFQIREIDTQIKTLIQLIEKEQ